MKTVRLIAICLAALIIMGFIGNRPLQHTYEGDVYLRWLEVRIEPLQRHEKEGSKTLSTITQLQRIRQRFDQIMDEKQSQIFTQQLHEFEQTLVEGIREASGIPLVVPEDVLIQPGYDNSGQLESITYEYPKNDGAYMQLVGNVYYNTTSSSSFGVNAFNQSSITVRPKLTLQINGYKAKRDLFWRRSQTYESNKSYRFGNEFILGVSTKKIEDAEIFLIPLAKGIGEELLKQKNKGGL